MKTFVAIVLLCSLSVAVCDGKQHVRLYVGIYPESARVLEPIYAHLIIDSDRDTTFAVGSCFGREYFPEWSFFIFKDGDTTVCPVNYGAVEQPEFSPRREIYSTSWNTRGKHFEALVPLHTTYSTPGASDSTGIRLLDSGRYTGVFIFNGMNSNRPLGKTIVERVKDNKKEFLASDEFQFEIVPMDIAYETEWATLRSELKFMENFWGSGADRDSARAALRTCLNTALEMNSGDPIKRRLLAAIRPNFPILNKSDKLSDDDRLLRQVLEASYNEEIEKFFMSMPDSIVSKFKSKNDDE